MKFAKPFLYGFFIVAISRAGQQKQTVAATVKFLKEVSE
jgi:hypothetical protein